MKKFYRFLSRLFLSLSSYFDDLAYDGTFMATVFLDNGEVDLALGFGPVIVNRNSQESIRASFNTDRNGIFRPTRLIILRRIAKHFNLHSFKIDNIEQLMSDKGVPASVFSEEAIGVVLALPPIEKNREIELLVKRVA